MRINYNVTGARRKELVKVISGTTGAKAEYKYMPTCNFEIGGYTVTKAAVGSLTNILEAKGSLIRKALGVDDLRFEIKEDRIAFPWFTKMPEAAEAKAYAEFISLLCKLSKELRRTSSKETPAANEKYAFRCFLLRLGFIGSEYKESRRILLKNLSGNSSWKNGAPEKETAVETVAQA